MFWLQIVVFAVVYGLVVSFGDWLIDLYFARKGRGLHA